VHGGKNHGSPNAAERFNSGVNWILLAVANQPRPQWVMLCCERTTYEQ
jgi:hypothetical protein